MLFCPMRLPLFVLRTFVVDTLERFTRTSTKALSALLYRHDVENCTTSRNFLTSACVALSSCSTRRRRSSRTAMIAASCLLPLVIPDRVGAPRSVESCQVSPSAPALASSAESLSCSPDTPHVMHEAQTIIQSISITAIADQDVLCALSVMG